MGGSVFKESHYTPRMPKEIYEETRDRIEKILEDNFEFVGHPIEDPQKTSYGDVDIHIAQPKNKSWKDKVDDLLGNRKNDTFRRTVDQGLGKPLARLMGADKWFLPKGVTTFHFVVDWPGKKAASSCLVPYSAAKAESMNMSTSKPKQKYIQIDVHIWSGSTSHQWHLFTGAHGDLWSILRDIIRPFGLVCNDDGLCLFNLEPRKCIKISDDTDKVLKYLGMDVDRYWRPFQNWDEIMAYAATCRFFNPETSLSIKPADKKSEGRSADKKRAAKRPMYCTWINWFLPAKLDSSARTGSILSEVQVVEDVKRFFVEKAAEIDDEQTKLVTKKEEIDNTGFWTNVCALGLHGKEKTYMLKGMHQALEENIEGEPEEKLPEIHTARIMYEMLDYDYVLSWAMNNYQEIAKIQEARDLKKSHIKYLERKPWETNPRSKKVQTQPSEETQTILTTQEYNDIMTKLQKALAYEELKKVVTAEVYAEIMDEIQNLRNVDKDGNGEDSGGEESEAVD